MQIELIHPEEVRKASERIKNHIVKTPIMTSNLLNDWLGHEFYFKVEAFQRIGAFKTRGVTNTILEYKERNGDFPKKVIAYSSGNHAQAVSWACTKFGVKSIIYMPKNVSVVKVQATKAYGAEVVITETRQQAEDACKLVNETKGELFISPSDNDMVIAGQGTSCFEVLSDGLKPDAIFASCGGGGWVSGTYLAAKLLCDSAKVYAAEPKIGNDASISYKTGKLYRFEDSPKTIADGARTLGLTERTFNYIKKLDDIYEIAENDIIYWTQWLMHLLKITVEPTSAMAMAAAYEWIKNQQKGQKILVLLSGGNIAQDTYMKIWENDYLSKIPTNN